MITVRYITDNDIVAMINLMNQEHGEEESKGYSRNEAVWITNTMMLFHKTKESPEAVMIGCFDTDDNELLGFITGDTFGSFYDNRSIADLKDCVVAKKKGLVFKYLFDAFLVHYRDIGIPDWRFDSIKRDKKDRERLVKFIEKHYDVDNHIETYVSVRGTQA